MAKNTRSSNTDHFLRDQYDRIIGEGKKIDVERKKLYEKIQDLHDKGAKTNAAKQQMINLTSRLARLSAYYEYLVERQKILKRKIEMLYELKRSSRS